MENPIKKVTYVLKQDVSTMTKPELLEALKLVVMQKSDLVKGLEDIESTYVAKAIQELDSAVVEIKTLLDA